MKKHKFLVCTLTATLSTLPLVACSRSGYQQNAQNLLLKIFNSYTETYQSDFWDSVEEDSVHTHRHIHNSTGLVCECPTDAILLWAYGPGYENWNHYLHDGKESEIQGSQVVKTGTNQFPSVSNPFNDGEDTRWSLKLGDYELLDQALNNSTVAIPTHAYHGFEPDESDMANFINSASQIPDFNITELTREQAEQKGFKPEMIVNKQYEDLGFMATAMDVTSSMHWIETKTDNYIVPFLEMNIDPSVHGAYISYSNKKFYDGFFLSWPWEYQLLLQRNIDVKVTAARWCKSDTDKDLLWINCDVVPHV